MKRRVYSLLIHAGSLSAVDWLYRLLYRFVVRLTVAGLRREPAVRCIYARRGFAKNEYVPLLSDIDLTLIVDPEDARRRVAGRFQALRRVFRVLEPQCPIYTPGEFRSLMDPANFPGNRSFLFRILEAPHTWRLLFRRGEADLLEGLPAPSRAEIVCITGVRGRSKKCGACAQALEWARPMNF